MPNMTTMPILNQGEREFLDVLSGRDPEYFARQVAKGGSYQEVKEKAKLASLNGTKNPTKDVALFIDPNKKERFLSSAEAQTLYRAVQGSVNPMLQFIIPMLILTGARKREVLDAKWEEFDLERKQWRVSITKAGKPRYIPLSDGVLQMLSTMPHDDSKWIFPNPKTRKPYVSIFVSWNTARKQAGLADVRMHDLRHSFASFLVNAGRSLYEVQKILGHTQIKTTQRYAHLSQDTLIDAANVVPFSMSVPMAPLMHIELSH